jgi:hypothetical protein
MQNLTNINVNQIIIGLNHKLKNDNKLLEKGIETFDSLYQYNPKKNEKGGNKYATSSKTFEGKYGKNRGKN